MEKNEKKQFWILKNIENYSKKKMGKLMEKP
jgi:hypothetical protein